MAYGIAHCYVFLPLSSSGQLGDNTTTTRRAPVDVKTLTNVAQISCGNQFTCATLKTNVVACWGDNTGGERGMVGAMRGVGWPVLRPHECVRAE
jgi:alpha-tubulin suppressor-like RCC1 family protein